MNRKLFKLVAILLILVLLSSSVLSTTFAKYVTRTDVTDEARVAQWGVVIRTSVDSLFSKTYTSTKGDDNIIVVRAEENVVAPGTSKSIHIDTDITGTPEVAFEVSNQADVELGENWVGEDGTYYCPLYFDVNGKEKNGMQFSNADEFESWIEREVARVVGQYLPGTNLAELGEEMNIDISWRWAFDNDVYSNDIDDTFLGNSENKAEISISFAQKVVQIFSFDDVYKVIEEVDGEIKKIEFGSYPQSDVTNEPIAETLNALLDTDKDGNIDKLPESGEYYSNGWTSYEYYINGNKENYMWYMDVEEGGEKYRGVYFTEYRPWSNYAIASVNTSSTDLKIDNCYQDNYGYHKGNLYWFRYDPISWTILEETTEGKAFIFCDMILDAQAFQNEYKADGLWKINVPYEETEEGVIYANNYAYSTVRQWLNDTFYDTAFSSLQKQIIITTEVKNDLESAGYPQDTYRQPAKYVYKNTKDDIFLLSVQEASNTSYGFSNVLQSNELYGEDTARVKKTTAYAKAQGGCGKEVGYWWLRSFAFPSTEPDNGKQSWTPWLIDNTGKQIWFTNNHAESTFMGIVPAAWIKL